MSPITSTFGGGDVLDTLDKTRTPTLSFHLGNDLVSYIQERVFVLHLEHIGRVSSHCLGLSRTLQFFGNAVGTSCLQ